MKWIMDDRKLISLVLQGGSSHSSTVPLLDQFVLTGMKAALLNANCLTQPRERLCDSRHVILA